MQITLGLLEVHTRLPCPRRLLLLLLHNPSGQCWLLSGCIVCFLRFLGCRLQFAIHSCDIPHLSLARLVTRIQRVVIHALLVVQNLMEFLQLYLRSWFRDDLIPVIDLLLQPHKLKRRLSSFNLFTSASLTLMT
jgi:hypothetical protein